MYLIFLFLTPTKQYNAFTFHLDHESTNERKEKKKGLKFSRLICYER